MAKPKQPKLPNALVLTDGARWDILREELSREVPWLARPLAALRGPHWRPGIVTAGVSEDGRVYVDPAILEWPSEAIKGVLEHEVWHPTLCHAPRARAQGVGQFEAHEWNRGADAEIHSGHLRPQSLAAVAEAMQEYIGPDAEPVTPQLLERPAGLTAEEYYQAALDKRQDDGSGGAGSPSPGAEGSPDEGGTGSGSGPCRAGATPSQPTGGSKAASGSEASSAGGASGSTPGSPSASPPNDASKGAPSGDGDQGNAEQPSQSGDGGPSLPDPAPGSDLPGSSGADGIRRAYEEPREGDPTTEDGGALPGWTEAERESIRRAVAEAIREAAQRGRGNLPGGLERWADTVLRPPVVDWRGLLRRTIQGRIQAHGSTDYSYRRPSRRDPAGRRGYISPGTIQPKPDVAVVIDTSGSMGTDELTGALGEVVGITRAVGGECRAASCDADSTAFRRVRRVEDMPLTGGGGTDMRVGIAAAERLRPRPQVCVVLTDGYTPWPYQRGAVDVVAVIVGDGHASNPPGWITTVRTSEQKRSS